MAEIKPQDILDDEFMAKIEQLRLVSRKVIVGRVRGERLTRKRGQSVEFADYRHYAVGDDMRFLDWNLYARLDRLFLKLFLEEEDLHVYILVDTSASMGYGHFDQAQSRPEQRRMGGGMPKLHYSRKVAAALAYIALSNYDRVFLSALSEGGLNAIGPLRGKHQVLRVLTFLSALKAVGSTSLEQTCRRFALTHRRKGVVVLISDFLDKAGYENALRWFTAANQDVFLLHVLAQEEMDPTLAGDLKLVDLEDGDTTEISISAPLLKAYRRNLEAFVGALKTYAGRRGMNYLLAPTNLDFDKLVLDYLRRRGVVE